MDICCLAALPVFNVSLLTLRIKQANLRKVVGNLFSWCFACLWRLPVCFTHATRQAPRTCWRFDLVLPLCPSLVLAWSLRTQSEGTRCKGWRSMLSCRSACICCWPAYFVPSLRGLGAKVRDRSRLAALPVFGVGLSNSCIRRESRERLGIQARLVALPVSSIGLPGYANLATGDCLWLA